MGDQNARVQEEEGGAVREQRPSRGPAMSFWLGLLGVACALPPTVTYFAAPGYWLRPMTFTTLLAPVLGIAATLKAVAELRSGTAGQAKPGLLLGIATMGLVAVQVLRLVHLWRAAG